MEAHSTINSANRSFLTQAEKIENLLRSRYGVWIPAYELSDLALQYCARINSIRKKLKAAGDSEEIENHTEWISGQCHGSYRIRRKDSNERQEPVETISRHDRAKQFEREYGTRPVPHPWKNAFSEKRLAADDCFTLTPPEPRQ